MKLSTHKLLFLLTLAFFFITHTEAQKHITPDQGVTLELQIQKLSTYNDSLQQQIRALSEELKEHRIREDYFNNIFDNLNYSYGFIITGFAVVLGLVALISWGVFWKRVSITERKLQSKFNEAMENHKTEEKKFIYDINSHRRSLAVMVGNITMIAIEECEKNKQYDRAFFFSLYGLDEFTQTHYDSLDTNNQQILLSKEDRNKKPFIARLQKVDRFCDKIIEKHISPNEVYLNKWNTFETSEFRIKNEESESLRLNIIYKFKKYLAENYPQKEKNS